MKSKKILSVFFMSFLIIVSVHLINAYEVDPLGELGRKEASLEDFNGSDHSACHGPDDAIIPSVESQYGYIEIAISGLSFGNLIKPGDSFSISVQVKNFTELTNDWILIGFPSRNPGRGDNNLFVFDGNINFDVQGYNRDRLDFVDGNSSVYSYDITVPVEEGTYTIVVDAIEDTSNEIYWTSNQFEVVVRDYDLPWIENVSITANPAELNESVTIQADILDLQTSIKSVDLEVGGNTLNMVQVSGNTYESTWMPTSTGNTNFNITAENDDNNSRTLENSLNVEDTTCPSMINLVFSESTINLGDNLTISVNITDYSGINQVLMDFNAKLYPMVNIELNLWEITLIPTSADNFGVGIIAQDNNNNWNRVSGEFLVLNLPPDPPVNETEDPDDNSTDPLDENPALPEEIPPENSDNNQTQVGVLLNDGSSQTGEASEKSFILGEISIIIGGGFVGTIAIYKKKKPKGRVPSLIPDNKEEKA